MTFQQTGTAPHTGFPIGKLPSGQVSIGPYSHEVVRALVGDPPQWGDGYGQTWGDKGFKGLTDADRQTRAWAMACATYNYVFVQLAKEGLEPGQTRIVPFPRPAGSGQNLGLEPFPGQGTWLKALNAWVLLNNVPTKSQANMQNIAANAWDLISQMFSGNFVGAATTAATMRPHAAWADDYLEVPTETPAAAPQKGPPPEDNAAAPKGLVVGGTILALLALLL